MNTQPEYDALIVGGRAAGGSLAVLLPRQGRCVLVVDRDEFPSDTMSTHFMNLGAVGGLVGRCVAGPGRMVKALFMNPGATRALAHELLAQLPNLLSPHDYRLTMAVSRMFAPAPEPSKA